jgi:hypothetical protein
MDQETPFQFFLFRVANSAPTTTPPAQSMIKIHPGHLELVQLSSNPGTLSPWTGDFALALFFFEFERG